MSAQDIKVQERDARHEEAIRALGIDATPLEEEIEEDNLDEKPKASEKPKESSKKSTEEVDEDEKGEEDEDDDHESQKSPKKTVPLSRHLEEKRHRRELESKLDEAMTEIEELKKTSSKKVEAVSENLDEVVDEVLSQLKDVDIDEGQKAFLKQFSKAILSKAKALSPQQKADLPEDIKEKLKLLDDFQKEKEDGKAVQSFKSEWNEFIPFLDKKYPNATAETKQQAYDLMNEIAHSDKGGKLVKVNGEDVIVGYELEYLLSKNQDKFDTILKTVPNSKSFEKGKNVDNTSDEDEEIDFLSPSMSPEKLAKYQEQRTAKRMSDAKKSGKIRFI